MRKIKCGACGATEKNGKIQHKIFCPVREGTQSKLSAVETSDEYQRKWDEERLKRWHHIVIQDAERAVAAEGKTVQSWWRDRND